MFMSVFGLTEHRLKSLRDGIRGARDSKSSAEHMCDSVVDSETMDDINMKVLAGNITL